MLRQRFADEAEKAPLDEDEQQELCSKLEKVIEADRKFWGRAIGALGIALVLFQVFLGTVWVTGRIHTNVIMSSIVSYLTTAAVNVISIRLWIAIKSPLAIISILTSPLALILCVIQMDDGEFYVLYSLNVVYVLLSWYAAKLTVDSEKELQSLNGLRYNLKSA
uniref:Uncharacterized protein n=1 Tax=Mucochytrium quahogii TaxID=96639 RepID=A0A7S2WNY4_9STRA|mmetsp:Transcript_16474/g.28571  ORF Transcript_16474/g.28571 Transcript_16474/m.28571 type:complete len:164 (+) Transcript_16474:318-809(+)|eukprot:CAMPEP_0203753906 /NCGR_PEP_ID=MMETSP0098-20131031/7605_1 /ASSEMBLY_ACC=CAM_ASM_000208 /TAXON_ID=96639 /ORGANISM=" , Strain NY0313808BC1" /LENGTH=163 /DNA_ID=CAMNT_0050644721 /DNA_START=280 /DNA_END=771 /DNA_ORIENTATION=+